MLATFPTTYSHVLFDLDGTLTDSAPGILASLRHAFDAEGLDLPTREVLLTAIGPPFELGLPLIGVPTARVGAVVEHYRGRYETVGLFENELYDGVVEMLDAIEAAGVVLGLATAKPEPSARRIVEHFGVADRFAVVAGATYEPGRRTKAEVISHALGELDVRGGSHVAMVGDRDHDILAARDARAGIDRRRVGLWIAQELTAAGADVVADGPADVLAIVRCG